MSDLSPRKSAYGPFYTGPSPRTRMSSEGHKTKTVVTTYCHLEQVSSEHYCGGWGAFTVPEKLKVVIESSERKLMAWDLREGAFELEKRV